MNPAETSASGGSRNPSGSLQSLDAERSAIKPGIYIERQLPGVEFGEVRDRTRCKADLDVKFQLQADLSHACQMSGMMATINSVEVAI